MAQDLYYVDSGYLTPDSGYYVYTADAEAAVSSQATVLCEATKITSGVVEEGSGNLTLVATMTVMISHIHGADLVAFSNAAIGIQINVIKSTNVQLTSVFSAAIDAVRGIYVSAQADAAATIIISNTRVRVTEAAHSAAFSLAASVGKLVQGSVGSPSRTAKTITVNGNAAISATQSKFGGKSIALDGTGDYLSIATNTDFGFGTGDFTIEGWFYKTAATSQILIETRTTSTQSSIMVQSNTGGNLRLFVNGVFPLTSSNAHTLNTWNHIAISRVSGVTRFFINGVVSTNTYTDTNNYGTTKPLILGASFVGLTAFTGFIDDFRVTKGVGRYTTTFTAPAAAFVNDSNTVLLVHGDTDISDDPGAGSGLQTAFSLTCEATVGTVQEANATLVNTVALTAVITKFANADVFAVSQFTQTASPGTVKQSAITTNAIFTNLVAIAKTGQGFITLDSVSTMSATVVKTVEISAFANSQFTQTANADKFISTNVSLVVVAALTTNNTRIRNNVIACEFSSELTAVASKIKQFSSELTAVSSVSCDTAVIKQVNATISSQASVTATVVCIRDSSSNLSSAFAQTSETNNSKLVGITSVMAAQATVSASPGTVKTSPITTNAIFTNLVAIAKTGQGFITLDVVATQITVPVKTAAAQANITASASVLSTANITRGVVAQFNNVSTLTISIDKTAGVVVPMVAVNTLTAVNTRFRNLIAVLTSVSQIQFPNNLTTGVSGITVVKDYSAALVSNFSTVIIPTRIRRGVAVINVATELGVKDPIRIRNFVCGTQFFVGLPEPFWFVTASLTASITRIHSAIIATDAVASQLTAVARTGQGFITLDAVATQTTQAIKTAVGQANINSQSTLSVSASRTISVSSQITSFSSLVCQTAKGVSGISLQASAGTLTAVATRVKNATAQLNSVSSIIIDTGPRLVAFQAALQVNAFNLAVVDIIHIDAKLTWQIFAEDRVYLIQSENRVYSIPAEDREYTLQGV